MNNKELVKNKNAFFHYEILEAYEAGLSLLGSEVKSLRDGGGSLNDAYIMVKENELFLINCSIAPYRFATTETHEEKRKRKLLLHRQEIYKLKRQVQEKGLSLIPLSLYLKAGKIKVQFALAKGKKLFDKREKIKEQEQKKSIDRMIKEQRR
jgi:SsrA-binding protein